MLAALAARCSVARCCKSWPPGPSFQAYTVARTGWGSMPDSFPAAVCRHGDGEPETPHKSSRPAVFQPGLVRDNAADTPPKNRLVAAAANLHLRLDEFVQVHQPLGVPGDGRKRRRSTESA